MSSNPITIRLTDKDREIIQRIIEVHSPPGITLSVSDAVKIALASWLTTHPAQ